MLNGKCNVLLSITSGDMSKLLITIKNGLISNVTSK